MRLRSGGSWPSWKRHQTKSLSLKVCLSHLAISVCIFCCLYALSCYLSHLIVKCLSIILYISLGCLALYLSAYRFRSAYLTWFSTYLIWFSTYLIWFSTYLIWLSIFLSTFLLFHPVVSLLFNVYLSHLSHSLPVCISHLVLYLSVSHLTIYLSTYLTWLGGTWQNMDIFSFTSSDSILLERHMMRSGMRPSPRSSRTLFWVGFVFCSPVVFGYMQQKLNETNGVLGHDSEL